MPTITINSGGFYFSGSVNGTPVQDIPRAGFNGLTFGQMQAAVILHEILHAAGVFGPDSGPGTRRGASMANSRTVRSNCF